MPSIPDLDDFGAISSDNTELARDHFWVNQGSLWGHTDLYLKALRKWLTGVSLSSPPFEVEGCGESSCQDSGG